MASSVLKEFLVSIGFDINEDQYRRFNDTVYKLTQRMEELATLGAAAAVALAAGVSQAAGEMDKLYFASIRTGASARNLTDLEYAFSQVGLSAEGALAAVEGVAKAINLSPGNAGLLAAFGINPNEDRTKATIDLLNYLHKNFSTPVGYQFAQRFGIDYNTFMADTNKLQAAFAQRDALLSKDGRDPNKEAVLANELQTHRRELDARFADLRYKAMEDFLPIGKQILDWTDKAVTWFNQLDAATNGWALRIGAVVTALGALKVAAGGIGMLGRLLGLGGVATEAAEGAGVAAGAAVAAPIVAGGIGIYELHKHKDAVEAWNKQFVEGMPDLETVLKHFEGYSKKAYGDIGGKLTSGYGHLLRPGEAAPANQQQAYAQFQRDMAATVAELHRTVKVMLTKGQELGLEDFIYNAGSGNFEKYVLPYVNKGDFAGASAHIQQINKYHNKDGALVYSQQLQDRRAWEASQVAAKGSPTLNAKTNIHITSVGDEQRTADAVKKVQDKTNTQLIRNLAGVMQ